MNDERIFGWVTVTASITEHPFASFSKTFINPAHKPETVCSVLPPVQRYVKGEVPPVGLAVTEPLHRPEQETLLVTDAFAASVDGAVSVMTDEVEQPLLSVTVSWYTPPLSPEMLDVVCPPGSHAYV